MALYVNDEKITRVVVNGTPVNQVMANGVRVWGNDIEIVGTTSGTLTYSFALSLDVSTFGIQEGDLILVAKGTGFHTTGTLPATPSGFTSIFGAWGGGSSTNTSIRLAYKYATGSETSINVGTSNTSSLSYGGAVLMVFRNVDLEVLQDVPIQYNTGNTYTNNVNPVPITPVSDNALIVAVGSSYLASSPNKTFTTPDMENMTYGQGSYYDFEFGYYYGAIVGMATKAWDGNGTFDPATWTCTSTNGPTHKTCTIALRPRY